MSDPRDVAAYTAQVGRLLDMAHELLQPAEIDALRYAIRRKREDGIELGDSVPGLLPRGDNIAARLLAQLDDADRELSHADVAELERLVYDRLDVGL